MPHPTFEGTPVGNKVLHVKSGAILTVTAHKTCRHNINRFFECRVPSYNLQGFVLKTFEYSELEKVKED